MNKKAIITIPTTFDFKEGDSGGAFVIRNVSLWKTIFAILARGLIDLTFYNKWNAGWSNASARVGCCRKWIRENRPRVFNSIQLLFNRATNHSPNTQTILIWANPPSPRKVPATRTANGRLVITIATMTSTMNNSWNDRNSIEKEKGRFLIRQPHFSKILQVYSINHWIFRLFLLSLHRVQYWY